jgi:hypothetical protein
MIACAIVVPLLLLSGVLSQRFPQGANPPRRQAVSHAPLVFEDDDDEEALGLEKRGAQ